MVPPACYSLWSKYSSNISRCLKAQDRKLVRLKVHDYHVLMQHILSLGIMRLLPKYVCSAVIDMINTFGVLCSKQMNMSDLLNIESQSPKLMCNLYMIFPPAFFNIIVHLIAHLAEEAKLACPIQYCWMYLIEMLFNLIVFKFIISKYTGNNFMDLNFYDVSIG